MAAARPNLAKLMILAPVEDEVVTATGTLKLDNFRINKDGLRLVDPSGRVTQFAPPALPGAVEEDGVSPDQIKATDLKFVHLLGSGSCGVVKKLVHPQTGLAFAMKEITLTDVEDDSVRMQILMELTTLCNCRCPAIVSFFGAYFEIGHINLALEYMEAGSLSEIMKTVGWLPEPVLHVVAKRVLKALHYLHIERRILHRDLKPSNILVNLNGEVKLADFGVSGLLADTIGKRKTVVGTISYMSPERIDGQPYSTSSDFWSLGITILELAIGRFPYPPEPTFTKLSMWDLMNAIVKEDPPRLDRAHGFSAVFGDFISQCLQKNPADRPPLHILEQHPFLAHPPGGGRTDEAAETAMMREWVAGTDANRREYEKTQLSKKQMKVRPELAFLS